MPPSKSSAKREEPKEEKQVKDAKAPPKSTDAPALADAPVAPVAEAPKVRVQLLRGMKDILPTEQAYWDHLRTLTAHLAQAYGYQRIDPPILEETALFTRAVGKYTDIVEKEMFSFIDQGGDHVSLRPEGTASAVRAYIEHGMVNHPQPVKLWYFGPFFRYDRPQAGRYRQFHQFGLEVIGEKHPAVDAELMLMASNCFRALGIDAIAQVNSIGCATCRAGYEVELQNFLKTRRSELCELCKRRMQRGAFLRVFDCKEPGCRSVQEGAPQIVDWLCEECKQHFIRVLEYLDELEVSYALAPFLVRGLDYYTKTVFEFVTADALADGASPAAQASIASGGRYDRLAEELGGRPTSAAGLAIGIERMLLKMKEAIAEGRCAAPVVPVPEVYVAQLGDQAKRKTMKLFEQLRVEGIRAAANFAKDSLKGQLEHANRLNVRFTLILGQKEVIDDTIIIREMSSGIQEIIAYDRVLPELQKRLTQVAVRESVTSVEQPAEDLAAETESDRSAMKDLPPPTTIEDFEAAADTDDAGEAKDDGERAASE